MQEVVIRKWKMENRKWNREDEKWKMVVGKQKNFK